MILSIESFEEIRLNFSPESLHALNIAIAIIVFGVSINIKKIHFVELFKNPKPVMIGVFSQFILLPALTFLIILVIKPNIGIALGMILVAACPGGNLSNFFSLMSKGNAALSVSLTAIATLLAVFMTPFNFTFWSSFLPDIVGQAKFSLSFIDMFKTILIILALPLALGLWFAHRFPLTTLKINKPIKVFSFIVLISIMGIAFLKNVDHFQQYIGLVFWIVLIHNFIAFSSGFLLGKITKNSLQDVKTITIETGIQNSALALIIIFNFFDGNGPMSFVAAWWGIWHIVAGSILAYGFSKFT